MKRYLHVLLSARLRLTHCFVNNYAESRKYSFQLIKIGDLAIHCGCKTEMPVLANFTPETFQSVKMR